MMNKYSSAVVTIPTSKYFRVMTFPVQISKNQHFIHETDVSPQSRRIQNSILFKTEAVFVFDFNTDLETLIWASFSPS